MILQRLAARTTSRSAFLATQRTFTTSTRIMASAKPEWIVMLPDKKGALEARMNVRAKHLENVKPHIESGFLSFGGAQLDEPIKEGQGPKINGSIMLANAHTEEEVWDWIRSDVYFTSGVWDEEKIQVFPFKTAVRTAL